jgi:hypothetical protein
MASTDIHNGVPLGCLAEINDTTEEESMAARIERLGRQRPEQFKTLAAEVGFCFSLLGSMAMAVTASNILYE